ncbi:MAG: CAP domain-containing protein [Leptospiraceae bacterium]|nr:CAP domain-containing protein [Leptospiraceae bacterium]
MRTAPVYFLVLIAFLASCQAPNLQERRVQVDPDTGQVQPHPSIPVEENQPPSPGPTEPEETIKLGVEEARFVQLVNEHRQKVGCAPLKLNPTLMRVARNHSNDMARRDFFSHTNPEGESPFDRMKKEGLRYSRAAENIAFGQRDAREVLQSWLSSPGHKRNIENCGLKEHGIGHHPVTNHWTHVFATLR